MLEHFAGAFYPVHRFMNGFLIGCEFNAIIWDDNGAAAFFYVARVFWTV